MLNLTGFFVDVVIYAKQFFFCPTVGKSIFNQENIHIR